MQHHPLLVTNILDHAARWNGEQVLHCCTVATARCGEDALSADLPWPALLPHMTTWCLARWSSRARRRGPPSRRATGRSTSGPGCAPWPCSAWGCSRATAWAPWRGTTRATWRPGASSTPTLYAWLEPAAAAACMHTHISPGAGTASWDRAPSATRSTPACTRRTWSTSSTTVRPCIP